MICGYSAVWQSSFCLFYVIDLQYFIIMGKPLKHGTMLGEILGRSLFQAGYFRGNENTTSQKNVKNF